MEEINNDKLFFKIWRNNFIKDNILQHLKLYSYNYWPRIFSNCQSIKERETKEYLNSIHLSPFPNFGTDGNEFVIDDLNDNNSDVSLSDSDNDGYDTNHDSIYYKTIKKKEKYPMSTLINKSKENKTFRLSLKVSNNVNNVNIINNSSSSISRSRSSSSSSIGSISSRNSIIGNNNENINFQEEEVEEEEELITFMDQNFLNLILPFKTLESVFVDFRNVSAPYKQFPIPLIPESVKYLRIGDFYRGWSFSDYFQNGNGKNLTSLNLGNCFTQEIKPNLLPPNLVELTIGSQFSRELKVNSLPNTLQYLYIGHSFDIEFSSEGILPNSLTDLRLAAYNQPFRGNILSNLQNLKKLILPRFNQIIYPGFLPQSLQFLRFGYSFKSKIKEYSLPSNLKYFKIQSDWKQYIQPKLFPISLKSLKFKSHSTDLTNLPIDLKYLKISQFNNKSLNNKKVSIITKVKNKINNNNNNNSNNNNSNNNNNNNNFNNLISLKIGLFNKMIYPNDLPNGLTNLELKNFNQNLRPSTFPNTIKYLKLIDFNNGGKPLKKDCLPQQLKRLEFSFFNQSIEWLPTECLEVIYLGSSFNQPIAEGILPKTLKFLEISCGIYDKDIQLPNETMILKYSPLSSYNSTLSDSFLNKINDYKLVELLSHQSIPPNCTKLTVSKRVSCKDIEFPKSIRSIKLDNLSIDINNLTNLGNGLKSLCNLMEFQVSLYPVEFQESNIPNTIEILKLGFKCYHLISPIIFPSLKELHIIGDACPVILNDDPTAFPNLHSIFVKVSHITFLDSIKQSNYFKYIKLIK
ncbi:hypothetical protein ACTFIR_008721 [Dictyostelium discoideum]